MNIAALLHRVTELDGAMALIGISDHGDNAVVMTEVLPAVEFVIFADQDEQDRTVVRKRLPDSVRFIPPNTRAKSGMPDEFRFILVEASTDPELITLLDHLGGMLTANGIVAFVGYTEETMGYGTPLNTWAIRKGQTFYSCETIGWMINNESPSSL